MLPISKLMCYPLVVKKLTFKFLHLLKEIFFKICIWILYQMTGAWKGISPQGLDNGRTAWWGQKIRWGLFKESVQNTYGTKRKHQDWWCWGWCWFLQMSIILINSTLYFPIIYNILYKVRGYCFLLSIWERHFGAIARLRCASIFSASFFFFFFLFTRFALGRRQLLLFTYWVVLFTHCSSIVYAFKNIKNGSHSTIHTLKNYFATMFSVFNF